MDLQVLRFLNSKKDDFSSWSLCVYVYFGIIQKQIMAEIPNLLLYTCIICRCLMNFFYDK